MKSFIAFFVLVGLLFAGCQLSTSVTDYASCVKAGYPVLESYPQQCRGPTGEVYVEELACTADVLECPDGSFVSRDPQNLCEFPACPTP